MKETIEQPKQINREAAPAPVDYTALVGSMATLLHMALYRLGAPRETLDAANDGDIPAVVHWLKQCPVHAHTGKVWVVHRGEWGAIDSIWRTKQDAWLQAEKVGKGSGWINCPDGHTLMPTVEVSHRANKQGGES